MTKLSQSERFQQAKKQLLSEKNSILPPGTDVSLDRENPGNSPLLSLINEALSKNGFLVQVFFDDTNFRAMVSDEQYDNAEGGVLATQISSIPYEWGYTVLPQIFEYFENHTELR